jgi:3-hydroxyacyl-[acyl-carrier-protein] dehydratase
MRWREDEALRLGADVIQRLIPHRRPLMMVDAIDAFRRAPQPTLWARRAISANEDVFDGHFPGLHLWPGVYTIEGLGQTTLLCAVIAHLIGAHEARGGTAGELLDALRDLDPTRRTGTNLLESLGGPDPRAGMAGHVDIKLLAPVHAGDTLCYRVVMTHTVDAFARFDVDAEVAGTPVARGTMTGVLGPLVSPC